MINKNLYSIQALRAIAAVLVMCFHFKNYINHSFETWGDKLFLNGDIGVDLFFMISGFIIYFITHEDKGGAQSAKIFFLKRFCRVFPPYFIITLMVAGSTPESWLETLKSLLFIPLNTSSIAPWFGQAKLFVGWTLNYEFVFYTIFTCCMFFKGMKNIALYVIIISAVCIPALLNGTELSPHNNYNYIGYLATATNSLMFEFLFGAFAAYLVVHGKIRYNKKISYSFILAASFLFIYVILSHCSSIGDVGYIASSFALLLALTNHETQYSFKAPKVILDTGKISFSLYLVHYRAKSLLRKGLDLNSSSYAGITMFLLSVALSFIFAYISYYLLESKLSSIFKKYLIKDKT